MEIIYPPLVEQGFHFYHAQGENGLSKSEFYRSMVANHLIHENGAPTKEAIEKGYVRDFYEEENLSFEAFLAIYPIFADYEAELFQLIDGFWEIPLSLKEELLTRLELGEVSYDEKSQIEEYLADR